MCRIITHMLFNQPSLASLVRSGFQKAVDWIGAGRYGALQPTLLSQRIPSLFGLQLPLTMCVHMYSIRVCISARVHVFSVLRSRAMAESNSCHVRCGLVWIQTQAVWVHMLYIHRLIPYATQLVQCLLARA